MLERLYIKNVALIEEADVKFDGKFNVLSGETGSGKSVILDSINFVLGSKADKSMIRYGTQEAIVKAEFSVEADSEVCRLLQELDIETDGAIVISRRFNSEGRGAIKVNGDTVTTSMLKKIAAHLLSFKRKQPIKYGRVPLRRKTVGAKEQTCPIAVKEKTVFNFRIYAWRKRTGAGAKARLVGLPD